MSTKVLALDISKSSTGWAVGDAKSPPLSGVERFNSNGSRGAVAFGYADWLMNMIAGNRPDLIMFEAPLLNFNGPRNGEAARLLIGLSMVTEMVCASKHVSCEDVSVQTWRKSFFGDAKNQDSYGRKRNWKREAMDACRALGWEIGNSDDRADACGVWAHAHLTSAGAQSSRAMAKLLSHMTVARMAR